MDEIESMLKELTEASGVSGYEEEARGLMRRYMAPLGEMSQDKLGSLICRKQGTATQLIVDGKPFIMLAGELHNAVIGFLALALTPMLLVVIAFQTIQRTANFAISNPAREVLFTVLAREEKYKAKNVIDIVVFRGADAVSGWLFALLRGARVLTSDEAINLIATVRLGVSLGIVNELSMADVSRLLILVRPQNLQIMLGETLTANQRDERRASFIRETLIHP